MLFPCIDISSRIHNNCESRSVIILLHMKYRNKQHTDPETICSYYILSTILNNMILLCVLILEHMQ